MKNLSSKIVLLLVGVFVFSFFTNSAGAQGAVSVDLKASAAGVAASNGPLNVGLGSPIILSWNVSGGTPCYKSSIPPSEFTGILTPLNNGSLTTYTPLGTIQYKISCGVTSDIVVVNTSSSTVSNSGSANAGIGIGYAKFAIGASVITTVNLNARSNASLTAIINGVVSVGTNGTVTAGPSAADGNNWYQVTYVNGMSGWSVETYLTYGTPSVPQPLPQTPPPAGIPNTGSVPTVATKFQIGDAVYTISNLNVRGTANGSTLGVQSAGAQGQVLGTPDSAGGKTWWNVNYATGVDGWSAESFLAKVNGGTLSIPAGANTVQTTGFDMNALDSQNQAEWKYLDQEFDRVVNGAPTHYNNPGGYQITVLHFFDGVVLGLWPETAAGYRAAYYWEMAGSHGFPDSPLQRALLAGNQWAYDFRAFWQKYAGQLSARNYFSTSIGNITQQGLDLAKFNKSIVNVYGENPSLEAILVGTFGTSAGAVFYPGTGANNYKNYTTDSRGLHTLTLNSGAKYTWGDGPGGTDPNPPPPPATWTGKAIIDYVLLHKSDPAPYPVYAFRQQNIMSDGSLFSDGWTGQAAYTSLQIAQQFYKDALSSGSTLTVRFYVDLSAADKDEIKQAFTKLFGTQLVDPETAVIGTNGQWIDKCSATITTNCF